MKKFFLLLTVLCMVMGVVSIVHADDPVRLGVVFGTSPNGSMYIDGDPAKGAHGLEYDVLTSVLDCMGKEYEVQDVSWNALFTGLLSDKWDIAACNIFVTKDRDDMMDFADPYTDNDLCFMVRTDSTIETKEDLKGKTLCCDTGAGSEKWLREHMEEYGPYTIQTYTGTTGMWPDVLSGRCDAALGDSPEVEFYVMDYPELKPAVYLNMGYKCAFAFRPDDPLLPEFNRCQRELKKDGTIAAIYEKYMGIAPQEGTAVFELYEDAPYVPTN